VITGHNMRRGAAGAGGAAWVPMSDGLTYNFPFNNFTDYTELLDGTGSTALDTFEGRTVFDLQTGTGTPVNKGQRQNTGAFSHGSQDPHVCSFELWMNRAGIHANGSDFVNIITGITSARINSLAFYHDVLRIKDYNNVEQTYSFTPIYNEFVGWDIVIDRSGTPWYADVYQNGLKVISHVSWAPPAVNSGRVSVAAYNGITTDNTHARFANLLLGGLA